MLLNNISNMLHNFTFSSVKVFEATAQRSLGWQGREILSMIPPPLFWGTFLQIWMQHSNKVGLHFDPNGICPDVGWNQAQERAKCHRLKCHVCNYASHHLPLTGLLLFWDNCTLGPKKCTHMAKTIHTRSDLLLMRNWAKAKINFALQLTAIWEILLPITSNKWQTCYISFRRKHCHKHIGPKGWMFSPKQLHWRYHKLTHISWPNFS